MPQDRERTATPNVVVPTVHDDFENSRLIVGPCFLLAEVGCEVHSLSYAHRGPALANLRRANF